MRKCARLSGRCDCQSTAGQAVIAVSATGAAGEWNTGFGHGIDLANVILVGARDLDPPEQERIDAGQIALVPVDPDLGRRLVQAIGGRPVYIQLDCDFLDAGLLATEYQSPNGLSYADLREAFGRRRIAAISLRTVSGRYCRTGR